MDKITPLQRSINMSRVHGQNTKPEKIVRSLLHSMGYRFRIQRRDLPGKPDIVLPKYKTIIFVHGCFWHQHHGCRKATIPATNIEFWKNKLEKNIQRDVLNQEKLSELGWKVITIWECETSNVEKIKAELLRIRSS